MSEAALRFGRFTVDAGRGLLLQDGAPTAINPKGVALLVALIKAGGKAVSKSDLMDIGWPS